MVGPKVDKMVDLRVALKAGWRAAGWAASKAVHLAHKWVAEKADLWAEWMAVSRVDRWGDLTAVELAAMKAVQTAAWMAG